MIRYENCAPSGTQSKHARLLCTFESGACLQLEMAVIGPSGSNASISADTPNMLELGTDGKMLVKGKRQIEIPSWPPDFILPNVVYIINDPVSHTQSSWETGSDGVPFRRIDEQGVVTVVTAMFLNSAGEPIIGV